MRQSRDLKKNDDEFDQVKQKSSDPSMFSDL
jgi:hypothetical protein